MSFFETVSEAAGRLPIGWHMFGTRTNRAGGDRAPMKVQQTLLRRASIQTTMHVYNKPRHRTGANRKVVERVLKPDAASA